MDPTTENLNRVFSIAPMMDWTDQHCRYFHRIISPNALLYTEMITTGALIHGDTAKFLQHNSYEYPLAIQLGGSDITELSNCAKLAENHGFQEVNLNVGCPSNRVQKGKIGACLMAEPQLVASIVKAMKNVVDIPITVKHRIGITGKSSYAELTDFIGCLYESGCDAFIIHAREAVLNGLSPKLNRKVPPLKYDWVYKVKTEFPDATIVLNGGIDNIVAMQQHLQQVDGIMLGREAYKNPYILAHVEQQIFNNHLISRQQIIEKILDYIEYSLAQGVNIKNITRHMLGLFKGMPKGKWFRTQLTELNISKNSNNQQLISKLQQIIQDTISACQSDQFIDYLD